MKICDVCKKSMNEEKFEGHKKSEGLLFYAGEKVKVINL